MLILLLTSNCESDITVGNFFSNRLEFLDQEIMMKVRGEVERNDPQSKDRSKEVSS